MGRYLPGRGRRPTILPILMAAAAVVLAHAPLLAATRTPVAVPSPDAAPWGRLIDVDGHRIHIWCTGSGRPAVVLEAGLGGNHLDWLKVQPDLAAFSTVCSYDRAGYGWSEPGPKPRTVDRATGELRALLGAAGVPTPVVLVGHSYGGLVALSFAERYRDAVSGLVLVDSMHPEQYDRFAAKGIEVPTEPNRITISPAVLAQGIPDTYRKLAVERGEEDNARSAMFSELRSVRDSMARIPLAALDIPVAVLAHGRHDWDAAYPDGRMERVWTELQQDLAQKLGGGTPAVVAGAGHDIHLEKPTAVIDAVKDMLARVRVNAQQAGITILTSPVRP